MVSCELELQKKIGILILIILKTFMIITLVLVITFVNHNQIAHGVSIALFVMQ